MTKEEIAKRFCKFELCTHRTGEGICCLFSQDNCIFHRLEKENEELKKWQKDTIKARGNDYMDWSRMKDQLTKAKDLIEDMYDQIPASHSDYYKDVMERARQFLKEN